MRINDMTDAQFDSFTRKVIKLRESGKTWNEVRAVTGATKRECHVIRGRMIDFQPSSVRKVA